MRRYETIIITNPDLTEEERIPLFERIQDLINTEGGPVIELDRWGSRRMAYEIKKKTRGDYIRIDFVGSGQLVAEIERILRIDDRVLKFMTVLLNDNVDPEKMKKEIAQSKEEASKSAEEEAEAATQDSESKDQTANAE